MRIAVGVAVDAARAKMRPVALVEQEQPAPCRALRHGFPMSNWGACSRLASGSIAANLSAVRSDAHEYQSFPTNGPVAWEGVAEGAQKAARPVSTAGPILWVAQASPDGIWPGTSVAGHLHTRTGRIAQARLIA